MPPRNPNRATTRFSRLFDRVVQQRASERSASPDAGAQDRLDALERRLDHLESLVEGLQDSVHREAVRHERDVDVLRKKTDPGEITRSLARHSKEKGL